MSVVRELLTWRGDVPDQPGAIFPGGWSSFAKAGCRRRKKHGVDVERHWRRVVN